MDVDSGGNGLQNFPVLDTAASSGGNLQVSGLLHSTPARTFTVVYFASPGCDPSGFGEGEVFLGRTSTMTDAAGNAPIDVVLPVSVDPGWVVTATATLEPEGATSEFSACVEVEGAASVADDAGAPVAALAMTTRPNPFRATTTTHFTLPSRAEVTVAVYDASGRLVRRLASSTLEAGSHRVVWDGRDGAGRAAAAGTYFYRLEAGEQQLSGRITLLP